MLNYFNTSNISLYFFLGCIIFGKKCNSYTFSLVDKVFCLTLTFFKIFSVFVFCRVLFTKLETVVGKLGMEKQECLFGYSEFEMPNIQTPTRRYSVTSLEFKGGKLG